MLVFLKFSLEAGWNWSLLLRCSVYSEPLQYSCKNGKEVNVLHFWIANLSREREKESQKKAKDSVRETRRDILCHCIHLSVRDGQYQAQSPLESNNPSRHLLFYRINIARKTSLILARISLRRISSHMGAAEMECWNIYHSIAYSTEGPLWVLVWSSATRSQIKYLSHLNK